MNCFFGACFQDLKKLYEQKRFPKTGGRYQLTGLGLPPHPGHNSFVQDRPDNQGYIWLLSSEVVTYISVC